jgi:hypothetical protein
MQDFATPQLAFLPRTRSRSVPTSRVRSEARLPSCALRADSGGTIQYAIGCESLATTGNVFFPSASQTRKPLLSPSRLGGRPRLYNVSSTLWYQTPTFMILHASSAVATLRPNCWEMPTAPLI